MKDNKAKEPLSSEALKRDEWRDGGASLSREDAPGHTLPESERDASEPESDAPSRSGLAGTIIPPD